MFACPSNRPGVDRSVARGEDLFNNTHINITNVAGLNDTLGRDEHSRILWNLS